MIKEKILNKNMSELEVSVPLAKFDNEEWDEFSEFQSSKNDNLNNNDIIDIAAETFKDTFSNSLEDLVNTFDEKLTKCFHNYKDKVEKYAPVQIRTQEEILNDCQMWWTITGNFGNMLPIDWNKSCARKNLIPALNLKEPETLSKTETSSTSPSSSSSHIDIDDVIARDLDLHQLISKPCDVFDSEQPIKSADEVIKEIDDIMQDGSSDDESPESVSMLSKCSSVSCSTDEKLHASFASRQSVESLSLNELSEHLLELESVIRQYSETLINELALRDELEFGKELKNNFISYILQVQNKRRNYGAEKQKKSRKSSALESKYLTTVIPYDVTQGPPTNQTIQILIKILKALSEDSPTVPTLLTDYILKVLCPS